MSEAPDPLEAELSALQPREVSPGLRRRVAKRLAEAQPPKPRHLWRIALAGGLAAACLAAVLLRWRAGQSVEPEPIAALPQPAPPVKVNFEADDSRPMLLAYERALARSPEDLDALLIKHALVAPKPNPELARIGPFTRSDSVLHALLGED
jgi:hypothetical protein